MKLHRNDSATWLSELAQQSFRERYPQLTQLKTHDDWLEKAKELIPFSFRLAIFVFVFGLTLHEFLIWQGWIFSTYSLDSQRAADILASSLEYIAGLVGIVLPIILIIVEFVSKDKGASSLVDVYLDKTNLKTTALWALLLLGSEAVFMFVFRAEIIEKPDLLLYSLFLFTLMNLALLVETGKTIWNLRNSLSNRFLVETLSAKLTKEIRRSQKIEIEYRLERIVNLDVYQALDLERLPIANMPQNVFAISSTKTGVIENIHLISLVEFAQLIGAASDKVYMTKLVNDSVQVGEAIAYVPLSIKAHAERLQKTLSRCFKVGNANTISDTDDAVKTLLSQVKQTAETSIREENKLFFDELMSVYRQIFELGIGLPIPSSTEWLRNLLFRGWPANQIAIRHLRNFVEIAARSENRDFIGKLSYEIFIISSRMIQNSHTVIDDNLSQVLDLYTPMYSFSHKYDNDLGKHRSYFYLTRDTIDRIWTESLEGSITDLRVVQNHYAILNSILGTLSTIVHQAFLNHDLETLETLLNLMQPKEFLARFHPEYSVVNEYTLRQRLEDSPESEKPAIKEEIEALRLVHHLSTHVQDFFDNLVFIAASYLIESYEKDEIPNSQFEELFSILESHLPKVKQTVNIFIRLLENGTTLGRNLFTRDPDTKRVFSPNNEDKLYLLYCLQGMKFLSENETKPEITVDLKHQLSRIEKTCDRIVAASAKWKTISLLQEVTEELSELAQKWIEFNEEIVERWQEGREEQIIESDLDTDKISVFSEAVNQAIREERSRSFLYLLEKQDKIITLANLENHVEAWFLEQKEYFTKLYPDSSDSRIRGERYGIGIVKAIDDNLIRGWINNSRYIPSRKDWETFQPYFERAIDRLQKNNSYPSCFLVPYIREHAYLWLWLKNTPDFTEQVQTESELPMLQGFYKNIPVYKYALRNDNEQQLLLTIDLEKAMQVHLGQPTTEIRSLTQAEIRQKLSENPEKARRDYLLFVSIKVSQPFDFEILNKNAIMRMKIKLSAE